ncbi:MAG: S-layer homology domain-containing protein [Solibacillus sp.]
MAKTNKGRKLFATTATAALVASAIVPVASAAEVNDINSVASYAKDAVQDLVDRGVIEGDAKGNFNPRNSVTRAEAATIFAKALDLESTGSINFSDVKSGAWYYDAIAAAVNNGVFQGQGAGKFNPSGNLTRSEAAVIYVNAFGLEGSDDLSSFKDASAVKAWAKEAIQIAVANGVLKGDDKGNLNPNANITKQDFAVMFARAEAAVVDPAADLKEALETLKTTSEKLAETVTAENVAAAKTAVADAKEAITAVEEALKAAQEAEVVTEEEVKATEEAITAAKAALEKAEKAVAGYEESLTVAKVESVSATNLKQVVVTFNRAVDKSTASEVVNYAITGANSPEIAAASVSEDGKSVTLTLKDVFVNQNEYKLSVYNIKAGDKVLNEKDLVFKPLDNTVPTVAAVQALGNKTIRVLFSEPIKPAQTSQFLIDGKVVVGSIQTTGNAVIIKLSSALTDGEHTITAEGTQDFNNFKVVKADTKFNVVEDKTAPTVTSVVSASFEKVVLKFSEPVEQVFASNVYWLQGAAKKQASSVKQLADDTFEFTFVGDNKLVYTTDLFVTNVKDYSGNVIDKDTKVQVTPVIDQTRPEVISAGFVKNSSNKKVVIKFTKSLDLDSAKKVANYVIKDKDGKVQLISSSVDTSNDKEVTITLLNSLKDNTEYTLTVNGVSDNTTLKNVILPYTTTLSVSDVTPPTLSTVTRLNDKQLYVEFSEAMATSGDGSVVDSSKYTITDTSVSPNKTLTPASYNVTGDAKGVILTFNDNLPTAGNVSFKVQLVKDVAGNYIANLVAPGTVITNTATTVDKVTAVATDKVEVTFTKALQSLNQGDFSVEGHEIAYSELSANGKKATFTLKTKLPEDVKNSSGDELKLIVTGTPSSVDILGEKIGTIGAKDITDEISATVKAIAAADLSGTKIKITFNEAINIGTLSEVKSDFVVEDNLGNPLSITGVAVSGTDNDELVLTLSGAVIAATISAKDVRFVTDRATDANTIADIEARTVELNGDLLAPVISSPSYTAGAVGSKQADISITSDEAGTAYYLVVASGAAAPTASTVVAGGVSEAVVAGTAKTKTLTFAADATTYDVYVVVKDATNNLSAVTKVIVSTPAAL